MKNKKKNIKQLNQILKIMKKKNKIYQIKMKKMT